MGFPWLFLDLRALRRVVAIESLGQDQFREGLKVLGRDTYVVWKNLSGSVVLDILVMW